MSIIAFSLLIIQRYPSNDLSTLTVNRIQPSASLGGDDMPTLRDSTASTACMEHQVFEHIKQALLVTLNWQAPSVSMPRKLSSLQFTIKSFQRHFDRVISIEDEGGYMSDVLDAKPYMQDRIDQLSPRSCPIPRAAAEADAGAQRHQRVGRTALRTGLRRSAVADCCYRSSTTSRKSSCCRNRCSLMTAAKGKSLTRSFGLISAQRLRRIKTETLRVTVMWTSRISIF